MTLKEKMKKGPVFGMACFTGTTCVIENIAMSGLDFIYLDLEHTNYMLDEAFEKQIMAAKLHDLSVLVRMADDNEVAIRKVLEWGADGVVIPHCKTAEMARRSVEGAKFAPLGRRGGETNVRAAGFGYHNFDWNAYIEQQTPTPRGATRPAILSMSARSAACQRPTAPASSANASASSGEADRR